MPAVGLEQTEGVAQVVAEGGPQGLPFLFAGHDPAAETGWIVEVARLQGDVEITHHAKGFALVRQLGQVAPQAGEPAQLGGVFLRAQGRSIGHVQVQHPHALNRGAQNALLAIQLLGVRIGGQKGRKPHPHILQRQGAKDRDAVVSLLAAEGRRVAQGGEGLLGEQRVVHLGFLEAHHLRALGR